MIALYLMTGVICTLFKQQQVGTPYEKQTLFIHDVPTYYKMKEEVSLPRPTVKLRGRLKFDGIDFFKTKLSQAYPVDMGLRMADLLVEALALKARAVEAGIPAPRAFHVHDVGLPSLHLSLICIQSSTGEEHFDLRQLKQDEEEGPVPGKVPNGGGCAKGLNEIEHVEWAESVQHGSCVSSPMLPRGLVNTMDYAASRFRGFRASWMRTGRKSSRVGCASMNGSIIPAKMDGQRQCRR